ncbi:MAG TPA: hypothetical protein VH158_07405 [Gemmatimonadales bacterium]|nr:hypothetical protein [Gemmatimonadales bacterium]
MTRAVASLVGLLVTGQVIRVTAQTVASRLASVPGSTRAAGLGGAGAALVGDAGAIFANPAAIATVHRMAFDGSFAQYRDGTEFLGGALALRLGSVDWGIGAEALAAAGSATTDWLGMSSVVVRMGMIAVGGSAKYAHQAPGGVPSSGWAGDAGLAIAVFDILALGLSVQNFGGAAGTGAHLPRRTRAGFTMNYVDPQGSYRLLTTVEGQWPEAAGAFLVLGVEGGVVTHGVGLIGRTGYAGHSVTSAGSPFTFGGSVEIGHLHLDYAYHAAGAPASDTHRFGLRWTP